MGILLDVDPPYSCPAINILLCDKEVLPLLHVNAVLHLPNEGVEGHNSGQVFHGGLGG